LPWAAGRGELPRDGAAPAAGQPPDAGLGEQRRGRHDDEQAEKGPAAAASRAAPVQPIRQLRQVRSDVGVGAEDHRNLAEDRDDPFGHQGLFAAVAWRCCRGRRRWLCHQPLVGERLDHRLSDRFDQLVILLLGHPGRRRRCLRARATGNQDEE
jgi:hypothetical protein